jgi:hypothetical protein
MDMTGYGYRKRNAQKALGADTVQSSPASRSPELSGEALRLLVKLEGKIALLALAGEFPRVLNQIALAWPDPEAARRCFDALMLDERGTREGFPQSVISELASLRHHYFMHVFPENLDPWQRSLMR